MNETRTIKFIDYFQTPLNVGTYEIEATLNAPEGLAPEVTTRAFFHIAGPRYFLSPSDVHSVFPSENGEGDYNNILPHVVLNRRSLPWERLVDKKTNKSGDQAKNARLEQLPFLVLLVFTEDEEARGDVTEPTAMTLDDLGYSLEPGEKPGDKVNVIDVNLTLLNAILPTAEELRLLAHAREQTETGGIEHQRAVVIANRLPVSNKRHIAHLVMLENRFRYNPDADPPDFEFETSTTETVRLVSLKSWQFNCTGDKPSLRERFRGEAFTFEVFCVPRPKNGDTSFESIRAMSYAALPYYLRWGDRAHTLYHGPLVASAQRSSNVPDDVPASADALVRLLEKESIFDLSLAAAWQLGRLLLLRDQSIAMAYFSWRRRHAQLCARETCWEEDGHLHSEDDHRTGLSAMPEAVRNWCRERLQLRGIPFEYLVPDARMLPEHALRLFRIHDGWMQCLLSGALSLGRSGVIDSRLEAEYRSILFAEDVHGRSGFLLRSPAVEEHPDLQVTAFASDGSPLSEVRFESIGPGLLLGLFSGAIAKLLFSLPPIGLHFGLKESGPKRKPDSKEPVSRELSNRLSYTKELRSEDGSESKRSLEDIAMRPVPNDMELWGSVVDVSKLSLRMEETLGAMTPGRFAFQMCEGVESVEFVISG